MEYLIYNTNWVEYLTKDDLSLLRQTGSIVKKCVDRRMCIVDWVLDHRLMDTSTPWKLNDSPVRVMDAYHPQQWNKEWAFIYWLQELPPIVPPAFWNYFFRFVKGYVSMSTFQKWCQFQQKPLLFPHNKLKFDIEMKVEIVGNHTHNYNVYLEEWNDIEEFFSIGIVIHHHHPDILGLGSHSMGWHSDDGNIYMDSLVVGKAGRFGRGDKISLLVDYLQGLAIFIKNAKWMCVLELSGEFMCNPLTFGLVCKTMNQVRFRIT